MGNITSESHGAYQRNMATRENNTTTPAPATSAKGPLGWGAMAPVFDAVGRAATRAGDLAHGIMPPTLQFGAQPASADGNATNRSLSRSPPPHEVPKPSPAPWGTPAPTFSSELESMRRELDEERRKNLKLQDLQRDTGLKLAEANGKLAAVAERQQSQQSQQSEDEDEDEDEQLFSSPRRKHKEQLEDEDVADDATTLTESYTRLVQQARGIDVVTRLGEFNEAHRGLFNQLGEQSKRNPVLLELFNGQRQTVREAAEQQMSAAYAQRHQKKQTEVYDSFAQPRQQPYQQQGGSSYGGYGGQSSQQLSQLTPNTFHQIADEMGPGDEFTFEQKTARAPDGAEKQTVRVGYKKAEYRVTAKSRDDKLLRQFQNEELNRLNKKEAQKEIDGRNGKLYLPAPSYQSY